MLKLIQDNFEVEESLNYYFDCFEELDRYNETLKLEIINYYNNKSLELGVKDELDKRIKVIDDKYKNLINQVIEKYRKLEDSYRGQLSNIENQKNNKIKELLKPLNDLNEKQTALLSHLEYLNNSKNFNPAYTEEDFKQFNVGEIHEYLNESIDLVDELLELNLENIDISSIPDDFWLISNRLNLPSESSQDILRAINIIGVFIIIASFSSVITSLLAGYTGFMIFKNYKILKPIQRYKDFIFPAFENEEVIIENITNKVNDHLQSTISSIQNKLTELIKIRDTEVAKLESNKLVEREELEDSFILNKEKIQLEIKEKQDSELNLLLNLVQSKEEEKDNIINKINEELNELRFKLQREIEKLNRLELAVVNENQLLKLQGIHLGKEILTREIASILRISQHSINKFENLPFGSYLFIYGGAQSKYRMQNLMQYIMVQIASRLRGDLLSLNIVDPLEMGEGVNTCGFKEMGFHFSKEEVETYLEDLITRLNSDTKSVLFGYSDIRKYNEDKFKSGSSLYPYRLNLIQNINIFNEPAMFRKLLKTTQNGIINLVLIPDLVIAQEQKRVKDDDVAREEFNSLMRLFAVSFNDLGENDSIEMQINQFSEEREYVEEIVTNNNSQKLKSLLKEINLDLSNYLVDLNNIAEKYNLTKIKLPKFEPLLEGKSIKADGIFNYKPFREELLRDMGKKLKANFESAKTPIFFFNDFLGRVMKNNEIFYKEPMKGVLFHFGYENGDVDKPFGVPFNDYNIHAYLGGRTGMGKSNAANVGINAALNLYSPGALEIYYMDFKEAEGAKYARPNNITPHFKCIATTSDPGYLLSLFKHIDGRMRYRQNTILPKYNAGKLDDIRENREKYIKVKNDFESRGRDLDKEFVELLRYKKLSNIGDATKIESASNLEDGKENTLEEIETKIIELKGTQISEIVIIIDEFTEALRADQEVVKQILSYIDSTSRLGRATGVHLFLMSQDVPDKMDAGTMGQIITRLALPVTTGGTSKTLVGNEAAADPNYQTKGNLLFNDRGGDENANVRIKIPIIQPDDMDTNLSKIREFALNKGYKVQCVLFNHSTPVYFEENLKPFLEKNKSNLYELNSGVQRVVIGDNVEYTENPAPVGFPMGLDEGENIVIISQSSKKRIELANTVVSNFSNLEGDKWLYILRGNKDFNSYDLEEEYRDKYMRADGSCTLRELETYRDLLEKIEWSPLKKVEEVLLYAGNRVYEDLKDMDNVRDANYLDNLIFFKTISDNNPFLEDMIKGVTDFNKKSISIILSELRKHTPKRMIIVEGVERIPGLGYGLDYSEGDRIKTLLNSAPYYGTRVVFTSSTEPQAFNKLEDCFKHRLVGTLDTMTSHKFRFMKEAPDLYGGYSNYISPDKSFKYKIFSLPSVEDEIAEDNRILIEEDNE